MATGTCHDTGPTAQDLMRQRVTVGGKEPPPSKPAPQKAVSEFFLPKPWHRMTLISKEARESDPRASFGNDKAPFHQRACVWEAGKRPVAWNYYPRQAWSQAMLAGGWVAPSSTETRGTTGKWAEWARTGMVGKQAHFLSEKNQTPGCSVFPWPPSCSSSTRM